MGRLLAIDYGKKRTGIAVSDSLQIIANGLTTIDTEKLLEFIKSYTKTENVEKIIVGLPKQMNNTYSESMPGITIFVNKLQKECTIPIEYFDERFTSLIAQKTIIEGGIKKKDRQNKALIDKISATIILQGYMESIRIKKNER